MFVLYTSIKETTATSFSAVVQQNAVLELLCVCIHQSLCVCADISHLFAPVETFLLCHYSISDWKLITPLALDRFPAVCSAPNSESIGPQWESAAVICGDSFIGLLRPKYTMCSVDYERVWNSSGEEQTYWTSVSRGRPAAYKFIYSFIKESSGCQATKSHFILLSHNTERCKEKQTHKVAAAHIVSVVLYSWLC